MTALALRRPEVNEWGWLGGVAALVAASGSIWAVIFRARKDEPYRLLEQYQTMVDTLRIDLQSARDEIRAAVVEVEDLQQKLSVATSQLADANRQLNSAKVLIDHLQTANGFGL